MMQMTKSSANLHNSNIAYVTVNFEAAVNNITILTTATRGFVNQHSEHTFCAY